MKAPTEKRYQIQNAKFQKIDLRFLWNLALKIWNFSKHSCKKIVFEVESFQINTNLYFMSKDFLYKSLTVAVLIVAGLLLVCTITPPMELSVRSITTQQDVLFDITHSAKVLATPDTATLQVAVVKEGARVEEVQNQLNTASNAVVQAIRDAGIAESDIKTVSFSINPKYRYNPETGEQSIDGYQAASRLEVRTTDFDLMNQVIDVATQAGANEVGQVNFVVDNRDKYVAEARQEAIEGAKKKAQEIAGEAGINLGRLVDIQVFEMGEQPPIYFERAAMDMGVAQGGGTNVQPGQNEIEVSVQLFYALQ